MYVGSNPSALRSRKLITESFLTLLEHTPLEKISVKQIMDGTDLVRQTFYQIFDSKDEILEHCLDEIFEELAAFAHQKKIENLCDAMQLFFSFLDNHKDLLRLVINNGKISIVHRKCREFLQAEKYIHYEQLGIHSERDRQFATTFVISGVAGMMEQWINQPDGEISANDLSLLVCRVTAAEA